MTYVIEQCRSFVFDKDFNCRIKTAAYAASLTEAIRFQCELSRIDKPCVLEPKEIGRPNYHIKKQNHMRRSGIIPH